jgi:hypothetical protein
MATATDALYRTDVFAPQGIVISTATTQLADVFARRERPPAQRRFVVQLPIDGQTIKFTYTTFDSTLPRWADVVLRSLAERWGAQPGWDSYKATPTTPFLVVRLLNILSGLMQDESRSPQITPLADGGVQAEWHHGGQDLEIVVPADQEPTYFYFNRATNAEEEAAIDANYARVRALVGQLR